MAVTPSGARVLVINAMGRVFMDALDDPFAAVDRELTACPLGEGADAIVVDMHAEATSEKMAMGHFCDGRASLVVGTHSHVPTADAQIFPGGTAFQADAGACADYDSVIGMDKAEPLQRFTRKLADSALCPGDRPGHLMRRVRGNRCQWPGHPYRAGAGRRPAETSPAGTVKPFAHRG